MYQDMKDVIRRADKLVAKRVIARDSLWTTGTLDECLCVTCRRELVVNAEDPQMRPHVGYLVPRRYFNSRWNLANVHAQCLVCNVQRGGNPLMHGLIIAITETPEFLIGLLASSFMVKPEEYSPPNRTSRAVIERVLTLVEQADPKGIIPKIPFQYAYAEAEFLANKLDEESRTRDPFEDRGAHPFALLGSAIRELFKNPLETRQNGQGG